MITGKICRSNFPQTYRHLQPLNEMYEDTIMKHGGILAHEGEVKGTTDSLNQCPDITELVGPWGSQSSTPDFS